jgi:DNA polymerase-1
MNSDSKLVPSPEKTLYLIDISSFIFRAFFAIRNLKNSKGQPTNAVYGVAAMLAKLLEEARPHHLGVAYDSKEPSFREVQYPQYKANRSAPPDDLVPQFAWVDELVHLMGMPGFRLPGVEADDLIATAAERWKQLSPHHHVVIVSSDKDLMQLVDDQVSLWDTLSGKRYDAHAVKEKLGVPPHLVRDYLGLVGDSSDNIPGVPGFGPKTASELLLAHGSLGAVLQAAKDQKIPGKKGENLLAHEGDAILSADLATVKRDVPLEAAKVALTGGVPTFDYRFQYTSELETFLKRMEFNALIKQWSTKALGAQRAPGVEGAQRAPGVEGADGAPKASAVSHPSQEASAGSPEGEALPESSPRMSMTTGGATSGANFQAIVTESQFAQVLEELDRAKEFGFDLETTSLNPREARLVGIALCPGLTNSYYIPVGHREGRQLAEGWVRERLLPFITQPKYKKIGQNLKYDWSVLQAMGIQAQGLGADTMVAAYLLDPEGRHNLQALAAQYLNYAVTSYEDVCGKGKTQIGFDEVPIDRATHYSAEDAWVALALWKELAPRIQEERLMPIFAQVDLPLVPVLAQMEMEGVCIDVDYLQALSQEFRKELDGVSARIEAYSHGPINLNSPKQIGKLLFEDLKLPTHGKTKTGYSTDASVLERLAPLHEVPRLMLEYREISKLLGTYVDPLPTLRDKKTGKIHTSYHQTVTATGRLSCSDPNLQNIPIRTERGSRLRRAFVASPGQLLVAADYSQIELRILAHMSQDPELCRSFEKGEDVHQRTASEIYGISPEQVTQEQRGVAKAINFGLMYGKTPFGLSQELGISRREADSIIQRYFQRYAGVKAFLDGQIEKARSTGVVYTELGRMRRLSDIRSKNPAMRANSERMAMNTPIQGTAADLMKIAMIQLEDRLRQEGLQSKLILQVHDEVVLDCPREEVRKVERLVAEVLEGAMKLRVPLQANVASGQNWLEL